MSLDMLKQYVLFQGFTDHPILADAPRYYLDKTFLKRTQIPCAPYVPAWIVARREEQPTQKNSGQIGEEISIDSGLDEPLAAQPEPLQRMEEQIEVPQEEPQEEIIPDEEGRNFEG